MAQATLRRIGACVHGSLRLVLVLACNRVVS
jgi:hypothetical protein